MNANNTDPTKSVEEEIHDVSMPVPHVVLLGAGASRAAFPKGDRNGHFLPLMTDFGRLEEVSKLLLSADMNPDGNFEEVYSDLAGDPDQQDLRRRLEASVYRYFSQLALPDRPTIYDHLIVSLRPKDVIATFNWDPFLIQAARRHSYLGESPRLLFLHGNVLHGNLGSIDARYDPRVLFSAHRRGDFRAISA